MRYGMTKNPRTKIATEAGNMASDTFRWNPRETRILAPHFGQRPIRTRSYSLILPAHSGLTIGLLPTIGRGLAGHISSGDLAEVPFGLTLQQCAFGLPFRHRLRFLRN